MGKREEIWAFNVGHYLRDTEDLDTVQHGAYILLLIFYWVHGRLPTDDVALRRIAKITDYRQWQRVKPKLMELFLPGWRHKRMESDIQRKKNYLEAQRRFARKRWDGANEQLLMPVDKPVETCGQVSKNKLQVTLRSTDGGRAKPLKTLEPDHGSGHREERKKDSYLLGGEEERGKAPRKNNSKNGGGNFRARARARQKWEIDLINCVGPANSGQAIELFSRYPAAADAATSAEIEHAGAGVGSALMFLQGQVRGVRA